MKIFNDLSRFRFGITSAIVTSMALMVGLDTIDNPRMSIIGALLVLAVADNISDSLGIHIFRESESSCAGNRSEIHTITNYLSRLTVTLIFVLLIMFLPFNYAILLSVILGLLLLSLLSCMIAIQQKTNPYTAILHHVGIAIIVVIVSHFVGQVIIGAVG